MARDSFSCGHHPRAGRLASNQEMPVRFRLAAPISRTRSGGCQPAQRSLQNSARPGQHRDAAPSSIHSPHQQRSSQVVRQRSHTPRTAGSNPASATISPTKQNQTTAREEGSNPPRLGRGEARSDTGARDHFPASVAEQIRHSSSKRAHAGAIPAGSTISPLTKGATQAV